MIESKCQVYFSTKKNKTIIYNRDKDKDCTQKKKKKR